MPYPTTVSGGAVKSVMETISRNRKLRGAQKVEITPVPGPSGRTYRRASCWGVLCYFHT